MTISLSPTIQIAIDPFAAPSRETVRFTMHKKLDTVFPEPLPEGYSVIPFNPALLPSFAAVARMAFYKSNESEAYPELKTRTGCDHLIDELTEMDGFEPDASFLVFKDAKPAGIVLSRVMQGQVFGEIQLVAVSPVHRRRGLAKFLLNKALKALHDLKVPHVSLQVNRDNRNGVRFFRNSGFTVAGTGTYG